MNLRLLAAATSALGLLAATTAANAAVTVVLTQIDNLYGDVTLFPNQPLALGETMIADFDNANAAGVTYSGGTIKQGPFTPITDSSPPPYDMVVQGDTTKYASVQVGQTSELDIDDSHALTDFSFYLGSPDTYNTITFYGRGGNVVASLSGGDIWGANFNAAGGQRDWGYRIYYDFAGTPISKITFSSSQDAFEFDGLAGNLAGVPEPASWALMILGFGGVGASLRARRRQGVATA